MPTAGADPADTSAWFHGVVCLPELDDRVWDARLVDLHEGHGGGGSEIASSESTGGNMERPAGSVQVPCQEDKQEDDGRRRGRRAGMGLLAVALAHNSVEVSLVRCKQGVHVGSLTVALPPTYQIRVGGCLVRR